MPVLRNHCQVLVGAVGNKVANNAEHDDTTLGCIVLDVVPMQQESAAAQSSVAHWSQRHDMWSMSSGVERGSNRIQAFRDGAYIVDTLHGGVISAFCVARVPRSDMFTVVVQHAGGLAIGKHRH